MRELSWLSLARYIDGEAPDGAPPASLSARLDALSDHEHSLFVEPPPAAEAGDDDAAVETPERSPRGVAAAAAGRPPAPAPLRSSPSLRSVRAAPPDRRDEERPSHPHAARIHAESDNCKRTCSALFFALTYLAFPGVSLTVLQASLGSQRRWRIRI